MRRFFCKRGGAGSQRGAAAIEFALVFVIFFAIFYATVSYSLFFLLQAAFNHAASEGARAAVSVDPLAYDNTNDYLNGGVAPVVRETVGRSLDWLPSRVHDAVLGSDNQRVELSYQDKTLTVRIVYRNYAQSPLLPVVDLPGIGPVFSPAGDIEGAAAVRLT